MRAFRTLGRLAFIAAGIVGGFLVLELGLQSVAWYVHVTGRELPGEWLTGYRRVLSLGDSNTYGLYLDRAQAYPKQLEDLWNETIGSPSIEVLNLGFPGTNSSQLLSNLPRMLEAFDPEVVIVLVGANDFWTAPVSIDTAQERRSRIMAFVTRHSRAIKLFDMLRRAFDTRELEVTIDPRSSSKARTGTARYGDREFHLGFAKNIQPFSEFPARSLARNLREIERQTGDFGADLILMTYASRWGPYGVADAVIEEVARDTGTPLIDLSAAFAERCPPCSKHGIPPYLCLEPEQCSDVCASRDRCPDLLFADHHPNARGYRLVAETIVAHLRED